MRLLLKMGTCAGGIAIIYGVLFLLAAVEIASFWIPALLFLVAGASIFTLCLIGIRNIGPETETWLPIEDAWRNVWMKVVIFGLAVLALNYLYWLASDDPRTTVITIATLIAMSMAMILNIGSVIRIVRETVQVASIIGDLRFPIRRAFDTRRELMYVYKGMRENRRQFWDRYILEAEKIILAMIETAKRATSLAGSRSSAFEQLSGRVKQAGEMLDDLLGRLTTATSQADLDTARSRLDDVQDVLKSLDDRIDAGREVRDL